MFTTNTPNDSIPDHLDYLLDEIGVVRIKNAPVAFPKAHNTPPTIKVMLDANGEPPF